MVVHQSHGKYREHRFTQAEVKHLLSLLQERKRDGSYYGDKQQYYKRTDRLIEILESKLFWWVR